MVYKSVKLPIIFKNDFSLYNEVKYGVSCLKQNICHKLVFLKLMFQSLFCVLLQYIT